MDHIRELRRRLLKAVFGLALGMIVGWIFFTPVWHFLEKPYCRIPQHNRLIVGHGCPADRERLCSTGSSCI